MIFSDYRFLLDVHEINSQISLSFKQGDTGRVLHITLTEEGEVFNIPEGCVAVFSAVKPDGKIIFNDCEINGNEISYTITPQTTTVTGKVDCEIRLYGKANTIISSPHITIFVHPAVYADRIESVDEVNVLSGLIYEASTKLANGEFVPKLSIGTVETLPAGSDATASLTGSNEAPILNLGIPQGDEGQAESLIPDSALSLDSTKPVQNKVLAAAFNTKADKAETEAALSDKANAAETAAALAEKADKAETAAALDTKADAAETRTALDGKVDKVSGKGLSSNDFTDAEKQKLAGIAQNANNYSLPDGGVTTAKLAANAVTAEKLSANARTLGKTVVLTAAGWADQTQTLAVAGVTAENHLVVSAAPASREVYNDSEIYCSAQADGSLTFACGSVPGEDVTVHVLILV